MKLIDKDALVAEIERIKEMYCYDTKTNASFIAEAVINSINNAINTLEVVKEVDLKKTINDYFKDWKFDEELDIMVKPNNYSATFDDIKEIARHFFELGVCKQPYHRSGQRYSRGNHH